MIKVSDEQFLNSTNYVKLLDQILALFRLKNPEAVFNHSYLHVVAIVQTGMRRNNIARWIFFFVYIDMKIYLHLWILQTFKKYILNMETTRLGENSNPFVCFFSMSDLF